MTRLIRNLAQSMLWRVMAVAFVLLLVATGFFGWLVLLGALLGAVLAGVVVELFHRDIDEVLAPRYTSDHLRLAAPTLLIEYADPNSELLGTQRARNALRVVDHWFEPRDQTTDLAHPSLGIVSAVPEEHRPIVAEYLQAGLVLGMAINDCAGHDDGTHKLSVGPGVLRRFEIAEKAYAELGYRPLLPVVFRQRGAEALPVTEQVGSRLEDGETPQLYADHVRRKHVG